MAFLFNHIASLKFLFPATLICIVVYGIIATGYRLMLLPMASMTVPRAYTALKKNTTRTAPSREKYAVIAEKNIFQRPGDTGNADTQSIPVRPAAEGVRLVGVLLAKDGHNRAVLQDSSGTQHLVRVDDRVAGMAVVSIRHDSIVIRNGDGLSSLLLEQNGPDSAVGPDRNGKKEPDGIRELDRGMVSRQMADIPAVLSQVGMLPHFTPDGRPAGIRLTHIQPASIMLEIGLQPNDIIRSINNMPVRAPNDIAAFYETLQHGETIALSVLRNGRIVPLSFRIR